MYELKNLQILKIQAGQAGILLRIVLKIAVCSFFIVVLFAGAAFAHKLKLKNGKVLSGQITEIRAGIYTIETKNGPVEVPEKDIAEEVWASTDDEMIGVAKKSERAKELRDEMKIEWYLKPAVVWLYRIDETARGYLGDSIIYAGCELGMKILEGNVGLVILYGSSEGSMVQSDSSVSKLAMGSLMTVFNGQFRFELKDSPVKPFAKASIGVLINNEHVDSFVEFGPPSARDFLFASPCIGASAGLEFVFLQNFTAEVHAGWDFIMGQITVSDVDFGSTWSNFQAGGPVIGAGLSIEF